MSSLFVGVDCSTQGIKATVIDDKLRQVYETSVNYDSELPEYETKGGANRGNDGLTITSPTIMWVAALEKLFEKMKREGFPFASVVSISGSGQQHGSVFWKKGAGDKLQQLEASKGLVEQCQGMFAIEDSPIWMDSSTTADCHELERMLGGPQEVAKLTGSVAYERFTIHQIRKIQRTQPENYKSIERISLVSSFLCSLLVGKYCNIDAGDASGMNAMNIRTKEWIGEGLLEEFVGDRDLISKLGPVSLAHSVAGNIHSYYANRFDFSPSCTVITCSGDNPCSLAGMRMRIGDVAISLGTSDTMFGPLTDPRPSGEGHIFCDPVHPDAYMALLCYKNGSLTREHIRDIYAQKEWKEFDAILSTTPVGNGGHVGFFFKETEITPRAKVGTHRFDATGKVLVEFPNPEVNVRAVVEAQFLSMLAHSVNIGLKTTRIFATGGASNNEHIIRVMANVFGVPVYTHTQPNSASLGAAYRALHGWQSRDQFVSFDQVVEKATPFQKAVDPNPEAHQVYLEMLENYKVLEKRVTV